MRKEFIPNDVLGIKTKTWIFFNACIHTYSFIYSLIEIPEKKNYSSNIIIIIFFLNEGVYC